MRFEHSETYRVTPERLWPLLANTDSLNRELSLPQINYGFAPLPQGGTEVTAKAKQTGLTIAWQEFPFEWITPRRYSVRRVFKNGPFKEFRSLLTLTPDGAGCRVHVAVDLDPAGLLGRIITPRFTKSNVMSMFEVARGFERFLLGELPSPYPKRFGRAIVDPEALGAAVRQLSEMRLDRALAERLGRYVAEEVDERVQDLQPFALADEWGAKRVDVLKLCLYATRAGLLDLRWHLICPICQGSKGEHDTMRKLVPGHECNSCNISFRPDLDRSVEVRFTPNRAIRTLAGGKWCMGGPMNTPHILAQFLLAPGESRPAEVSLPPGKYAVRRAGALEPWLLEVGDGAKEAELVLGDGALPRTTLAPEARIVLRNALNTPLRVGLERPEERPRATAAVVTAIQEFRDLYATEALSPGVELAIGSLAVFFSDLRGSTALYEKIGDAPAYAVVRKHFEFMMGHIREHEGAVVKTMGDAVMAVFRNPANAVRCALDVQKKAERQEFVVKIGIHSGACIAVSSTDYLDYFGSTVNIAQRSQTQSVGGDVVVTDAVMRVPGVGEVIVEMGAHESSFAAALKGFESRFTLHRIVLHPAGDTAKRAQGV